MLFKASIQVMPIKGLLDPQGKAVNASLHNMGLNAINNVRIGKEITMEVEAADKAAAETQVKEACDKLLHNAVMEEYTFELSEA
jgi:phosphoribosylformylglycinamidine synthase subunit PurS